MTDRLASQATEIAASVAPSSPLAPVSPSYKWVALSNTTIAVLLATINSSIMLIAMPEIFRGIGLNPLEPANTFYLLWMILGFQIVSSVLVVSLGRLGDMFGRVRMYNYGFVIFTVASLLLTIDPFTDAAARSGSFSAGSSKASAPHSWSPIPAPS